MPKLYDVWRRRRAYLSATQDLANKEIVAYNINTHLGLEQFIRVWNSCLKTKRQKIYPSKSGITLYASLYINKLKEFGVMQSMSKKGNFLDNPPIESFFRHMKDEIELKSCQSFEEVKELVEYYIYYYNNERCQWNLNKMTPVQY